MILYVCKNLIEYRNQIYINLSTNKKFKKLFSSIDIISNNILLIIFSRALSLTRSDENSIKDFFVNIVYQ